MNLKRQLNLNDLPKSVKDFVDEKAKICQPDKIYVCDGSEEENNHFLNVLEQEGSIIKLDKMENW